MSEAFLALLTTAATVGGTVYGIRSQRRAQQSQETLARRSQQTQEAAQQRQQAALDANDPALSRRNPRGRRLFADAATGATTIA